MNLGQHSEFVEVRPNKRADCIDCLIEVRTATSLRWILVVCETLFATELMCTEVRCMQY